MAKEFVAGYRSVLIRNDVKERLLQFSTDSGFLRESMVERCLASAAIDIVLSNDALRSRLLRALKEATVKDIQAILGNGPGAAVPSSPISGTAAAPAEANLSPKESNT